MRAKVVYRKIDEAAHRISRKKWQKKQTKHHYETLEKTGVPIKRLNAAQKEAIRNLWGVADYSTHELIYSVTGSFDVNYCPESVFFTKLEFLLNNQKLVTAWADKNYFDKFFPEVRFPVSIIRNISGTFYDKNYKLLRKKEAIEILKKYDKVCIKPSMDSGTGKGVLLIQVDKNIEEIMDKYKTDYVIQEILQQLEETKSLNPSSVNIVRVCSLFINNKATVLSASLRCGAEGHFNDNSITPDGKGMFVIGVDSNGKLGDKAYYPCGEKLKIAPNGTEFSNIELPSFEKAKELVVSVHEKMPFAGFIGFDIAFEEDGNPVIMEYNLKAPGVFYYQLVNGPLFGKRTQEVIDTFLCKKHS